MRLALTSCDTYDLSFFLSQTTDCCVYMLTLRVQRTPSLLVFIFGTNCKLAMSIEMPIQLNLSVSTLSNVPPS